MGVRCRKLLAPIVAGALPLHLVAQAPKLPFERDLQLAWASSITGKDDWETILTLERVDSAEAQLRVSWNRGEQRQWQHIERAVSNRERRLARSFYFFSSTTDRRSFRGSTQSLASAAILDELKRAGRASVVLLMPEVSEVPFRGTLVRVGTATETFPVLLDGKRVTLQGVRARGLLVGDREDDFEVLLLDDAEAPWVLEATAHGGKGLTGGHRLLVRISTSSRGPALEMALEKKCITSIHDIYFASGSDALDSTSAPALASIAQAMRDHADWRITIVGHTDSIGTAPANLDLSRRRAERVRSTLAQEYAIASDRLRADGKGETAPIDDNGSLFGRARNRRVDLERACPTQNKK